MKDDFSAFDFHIHSQYSYDSLCTIRAITKAAKRRNLSGFAITDHNTLQGAVKASLCNSEMAVIIGEEISTDQGDIIGLFLHEEVKPGQILDVIDQIRDQDGLIVLPHPFKKNLSPSPEVVANVDIIEVLNGRRPPEMNRKAAALAEKHDLPGIGGSDAHLACEVGRVQTVFNQDITDPEDIRRLITQKKATVEGTESSQYVHYPSVLIGSVRTGNYRKLVKSAVKRIPF
ncbi:PHP domain-containing protein [Methanocalculus sp.]|uniref:PHP domain-containing protein n=1 Tax=Methanocalculus sp. TaxID=2004547 RepID=UPI00262B7C2C|nr:PHP domain-containing protein [Methanocalculus sp.]MDG6250466.1 PHP domain-containing protein [Methanocalculus sp.]